VSQVKYSGTPQSVVQTQKLQEENVAVFNNRVNMKEFQWSPDIHTLLHELHF